MLKRALLFMFVVFLSACSNEGVSQQTLVAFEAHLDQQREVIGATSTAEHELLLLTLDYSYVELTRTQSQYNSMNIILATRGMTVEVPTQVSTLPAPDTPAPFNTPEPNQPPIDVIVTPFMSPTPEIIPTLTPDETIITQPTTTTSTNNLRDIVLSSSVGDDDCANGITNTFTTQSERIYIVALAFDIAPNTDISSVWYRGDEQLTVFTFTPSFPINNACIWFYADTTDFTFSVGSYDVILQLNGQDVTPPIGFTITE